MKRRFPVLLLCLFFCCLSGLVRAQVAHYGKGDVIDPAVFVSDAQGSAVSLGTLLATGKLTVLYIFGGGDMGYGLPGHLWCQDSFEDSHILRSLHGKYREREVNFVAVAAAPVYHSQVLGAPAGVFHDESEDSEAFKSARSSFIDSTLAAHRAGILPVEPWFDLRFRLLLNRNERLLPGAGFGELAAWHGAFRAQDEDQFYGVPAFWILSPSGEVLAEPFRGNVYHPHGMDMRIAYTLRDIDQTLQDLLDP